MSYPDTTGKSKNGVVSDESWAMPFPSMYVDELIFFNGVQNRIFTFESSEISFIAVNDGGIINVAFNSLNGLNNGRILKTKFENFQTQ